LIELPASGRLSVMWATWSRISNRRVVNSILVIPPFHFGSSMMLNQFTETILKITFSGFVMHEPPSSPSFFVSNELLIEINLLSIRIKNQEGFGNIAF
jgi:hypothetical protein